MFFLNFIEYYKCRNLTKLWAHDKGPVHPLLVRCEGQAVSETAMHAVLVVIGNQPIESSGYEFV